MKVSNMACTLMSSWKLVIAGFNLSPFNLTTVVPHTHTHTQNILSAGMQTDWGEYTLSNCGCTQCRPHKKHAGATGQQSTTHAATNYAPFSALHGASSSSYIYRLQIFRYFHVTLPPLSALTDLHCKIIRISTYISAASFPHFNGTGSIRICICKLTNSLFRWFTDTNIDVKKRFFLRFLTFFIFPVF